MTDDDQRPVALDPLVRKLDMRAAIDRVPAASLHSARVEVVREPVTCWVILDRCEDLSAEQSDYCLHGQATCAACGQWCWLGSATQQAVTSRSASPICRPCAATHVPAGTRPVRNVRDHRRADGAH
jgi:hypothetical protein